jgi:predicted XRE-type DNA-binding protein
MNDDDITITESCGNVFADLGFDPAEAEIMKLRAEVMILTARRLKEQGWTQASTDCRIQGAPQTKSGS